MNGTAAAAGRRRLPIQGLGALLVLSTLPAQLLAPLVCQAASRPQLPSSAATRPQRFGGAAAWLAQASIVPPAGAPSAGDPEATQPAAGQPPVVLSDAAFIKLLATASLEEIEPICRQLAQDSDSKRLRLVRERLLTIKPAPQPLAVVLANAEVLLSCQAPDGALTVLDRYGPAPGSEQVQWLTLQWRAANAGLDHRRAALALESLSAENYSRLETLLLPIQRRPDGSVISRAALQVLADHLEALGQRHTAAQLLLLSRQSDGAGAARLQQAIRLLADLPPQELDVLLERALEQAAAAGAWSLVSELLSTQAVLPGSISGSQRAVERQLRLSRRLDDAYGEWQLRQQDPAAAARSLELNQKLRSPWAVGGHSAELPSLEEANSPADQGAQAAPPAAALPPTTPAPAP